MPAGETASCQSRRPTRMAQNGCTMPWTLVMKPLRKLGQWLGNYQNAFYAAALKVPDTRKAGPLRALSLTKPAAQGVSGH